ncbi:MAG: hypothetical protein ABI780_06885 [Ardenticatenales bacterium]
MQEHKAALSPLWSDATRTTDELATRTTEFNAVWATVPPGAIAADIATSIAEATADPSLMPIQKLDAIIDYVAPTPNARRPWDTPRDEELKEVDRCQEEYALPGHGGMRTTAGVTAFDYHRIDITGDRANVDVTIDAWFSPFGLDAASDQRERWQKEFRYVLERRAVTWRIVSEWFDFQP